MDYFHIIEGICRDALVMGRARDRVVHLRLALERDAREAGAQTTREEARRQAEALAGLLKRTKRQRLPKSGELPTPETAAKLVRPVDRIADLVASGELSGEEAGAAGEIRRVFSALQRGLIAKARGFDRKLAGKARSPFVHPLERMTGDEAKLYQERYLPWARRAGGLRVCASNLHRKTALELVIDIAVDGRRPFEVGSELGLPSSRVAAALATALSLYAGLARRPAG